MLWVVQLLGGLGAAPPLGWFCCGRAGEAAGLWLSSWGVLCCGKGFRQKNAAGPLSLTLSRKGDQKSEIHLTSRVIFLMLRAF